MADVQAVAEVVVTTITRALAPLQARLTQIDAQLSAHLASVTTEVTLAVSRELGPVRERLAVLETRAPVPGPPGKDGTNGADGFSLEDFAVDFDGDRTITLAFARPGREAQRFPLTLPFQKYQGPYQTGRTYVAGDTVSLRGCEWHCNAPMTTARPGESGADWTLAVKCGRDGRDLRADRVAP
jgi:hypothetical protein